MAESLLAVNGLNQFDYQFAYCSSRRQEEDIMPPPSQQPSTAQSNRQQQLSQAQPSTSKMQSKSTNAVKDNPREVRNKAEKMRRDRLNQSIAELASIVPPVVAAHRKVDKTTVLRLTAHYLRAHEHVFGDSIGRSSPKFTPASMLKVMGLFNGFLMTVTYRGIIVVVSQNVQHYLGYTELDLIGTNLLTITHESDRAMLTNELMPKTQHFGSKGELVLPHDPAAKRAMERELAQERRSFIIRFKKLGQRSEPSQYVTCQVEGTLRKSDKACGNLNPGSQIVRRVRARSDNPCSSGNDIVFVGMVRPSTETFFNESALESCRMEYRTRHTIDGQIIQCEARIAVVTGYMMQEVYGVNAMNFMHRKDVRWVIIALREMYNQHQILGESCYRLMTKSGYFVYMKTRGRLEVDQTTGECTSFVCTNTVVDEKEGKYLLKSMKEKFSLMISDKEMLRLAAEEDPDDDKEDNDEVEHPRLLGPVILHLVTNLPSPSPVHSGNEVSPSEDSTSSGIVMAIIPPNKENVVSGVDKIYNVVKHFQREETIKSAEPIAEMENEFLSTSILNTDAAMDNNSFDNYNSAELMLLSDTTTDITTPLTPFREVWSNPADNGLCLNRTDCSVSNTEPVYTMSGHFDNWSAATNSSATVVNYNQIEQNIDNHENEYQAYDNSYEASHLHVSGLLVNSTAEIGFNQMVPELNNRPVIAGNKRHGHFDNDNVILKKKITKMVAPTEPQPTSMLPCPNFDNFFDETLFDSQIESALNSLDTIDPNLPELLVATDVQEILRQLEYPHDYNQ